MMVRGDGRGDDVVAAALVMFSSYYITLYVSSVCVCVCVCVYVVMFVHRHTILKNGPDQRRTFVGSK